ncbi:MAG: NADH-quinone oxidoreductase subunit NuoG [Microthrixaceae bacterium]|nr:NADH-quinone oxidoreductase subunit NuoG [Microthrixaceae bacterium]
MAEKPPPIEVTDPVTITLDGTPVQVQRGDLLIDAAERAGTYIPRFCYHSRMNPVGMCRMCLVEVDAGRGPSLQPSCMLECSPDMVVVTDSDLVKKVQEGVLEYLLLNHPLDCPVCDKGGECPLQDHTMAYGPGESRWLEEKRHYAKPVAISETVYLDRERCILCDRCTRFAKEVAGDPLIHFMDRGAATQVNTFPDDPFASYFSGNTVQICPVGALTAKPYRFKARPWDLSEVESTCTGCSVGCRIAVQSSRNEVLRYMGVDSPPVNWGWVCDKGRFSFEAVGGNRRLTEPQVRKGDVLVAARWSDALDAAAAALRGDPSRIAVLGGARLTNEAAFAWARLTKGVIGTDNVDAQLGDGLPAELLLSLPAATIDQTCEPGGTILYLGPDPKEELPVLFLRLKHAVLEDRARLFELAPADTGLTRYATRSLRYVPGAAAAAVAGLLAGGELGDGPIRVVLGRASVAESAATIVDAAMVLVGSGREVTFLPALRRANVAGAIDMGLSPALLPGRQKLSAGNASLGWPKLPAEGGLDATGILQAAADGHIDTLVLLGADPLADFPDRALAERALTTARTVISLDTFGNDSNRHADVVLAAAGFAEVSGTTTNLEGRVTALEAKVTPPGTARADWSIANEIAERLGTEFPELSPADLTAEIARVAPSHAAVTSAALDAAPDGIVVGAMPLTYEAPEPTHVPAVDSYSLRLVAGRSLYGTGTVLAHCPSSAPLAKPSVLRLAPAEAARLGLPDGGRVRVVSNDRSFVCDAAPDPGVPEGIAAMYLDGSASGPTAIIDAAAAVTEVRVEAGS